MEVIAQNLDDILATLQPLIVDWKDETARRVIARLQALPAKQAYDRDDVNSLLDEHFDDGMLICRLFLGLSDDQFGSVLRELLGKAGIGIKSYRSQPAAFLDALGSLGILAAMAGEANRTFHWSDVVVERLRSGRGSAISGQRRGRIVENCAETILKSVFGTDYQARCTFAGRRGLEAKCDFAIPSKTMPRIVIEAKGYGATGSKMTDILGDMGKIIAAKRPDTAFLFFTDGLPWRQRRSDLRRIVELQNTGDIARIYTFAMAHQFEADLRELKADYRL